MMKWSQSSKGFTFIELVTILLILGVLAAVAVPKFMDLSSDAKKAATNSIAASLSAANNVNYAARKNNPSTGVAVSNCTDLANALPGGLPTEYTISSEVIAVHTTTTCTLIGPGTATATFKATGIS